MRSLLIASILFSLIAGCAVRPTAISLRVQETNFDYIYVNKCKHVGHARRTSGWGGLVAKVGLRNAKTAIKEDAARMGGTHIVWTNFELGYVPVAEAEVFVCGSGFAAPIFEGEKE